MYQTYRDELAKRQELSLYHHPTARSGSDQGWSQSHSQRLAREINELARYFETCDSTSGNTGWIASNTVWAALRAIRIPLDEKSLCEAGKRALHQGKIEWRPFLALLARVPPARPAGVSLRPALKNQHRNMYDRGANDAKRMEIISAFGGSVGGWTGEKP